MKFCGASLRKVLPNKSLLSLFNTVPIGPITVPLNTPTGFNCGTPPLIRAHLSRAVLAVAEFIDV